LSLKAPPQAAGIFYFELIGPPADQGLRQWLQDDYDRIIPPAPW